ncbi:DUF2924 domain-containing protein [Aromatoleum bremense]|uniref:DUF2924 domain-containing protein n=1 Tax=Aromatoleum bremense TaxID=76115 RepID=A0ABX1NY52_9RHOO|nr:DUF2924 domain-containing protein [Aromatoleum bremense]NMG16979.1 DUF2924 domain-containing protein [Aromatoleum bremense]QTQ33229.1 putative protein DUf2924 [Aromatoleum bremense]
MKASSSSLSVAAQVAALPELPMPALWTLWDQHFPRRPNRVNRGYLEARLAYRLQELAYGGLPAEVKAHLADCGERHSKIKTGRGPQVRLMPGAVLVREWEQREYRVVVTADGQYALDGKSYRSLSAVARAITGTHWSGPAFFGLKKTGGGR